MPAEHRADLRCPVLLLTGGLGSGKTTLLRHWLRQEVLQHCALIINEIGEVAFDEARIGPDIVAAGVLSQQCVCCSGLPDLQETLERFFWDRLHRKMRKFDRVVIETTGVANPQPVVDLLTSHPFLRQKFRIEAVISTYACVAQWPARIDAVARQQMSSANALVLTKQDRVAPEQAQALVEHLRAFAPSAAIATSGLYAFPALAPLLQGVMTCSNDSPAGGREPANAVAVWAARPMRTRHTGPDVRTWFEPLAQPLSLDAMRQRAAGWVASAQAQGLMRFKGFWRCEGLASGAHPWEVQWTEGDVLAQMAPVRLSGNNHQWGVTFIADPALFRPTEQPD
jgi:G3E family GTPase